VAKLMSARREKPFPQRPVPDSLLP
jgi:hypothetical protein